MSPATLTERGVGMLADLPPYEADDPWVQSVIETKARELERVDLLIARIVAKALPHAADDEFRFLGLWETMLGLPVETPGVSVEDRRNKLLATIQTRSAVSGSAWITSVTIALGSADWQHQEGPGPYEVSITIPTNLAYTVGTFTTVVRRITPAHLDVHISTAARFIIGHGIQDPDASLINTTGHVL